MLIDYLECEGCACEFQRVLFVRLCLCCSLCLGYSVPACPNCGSLRLLLTLATRQPINATLENMVISHAARAGIGWQSGTLRLKNVRLTDNRTGIEAEDTDIDAENLTIE